MTSEVFLDSNVLLYACSSASDDAEKRGVAEDLILNHPFALSAQVLQEFIANAMRKPRVWASARRTSTRPSKWRPWSGCNRSAGN